MKAICASENFDLFMVLPRLTARIRHAAKLEFSSKDRSSKPEAGQRLPGQQISQFVIGIADQRGPEAGLSDAMFLPEIERDLLEALQRSRKSARYTAVNTHFIDHEFPPENKF